MKKSDASQGRVGIGAHLEENHRPRGLARGNPRQDAQAHQESGPGRRRGVEVDRRHPVWSHDGIICTGESYKNAREADLRQGRVSEGSGPSLQLESRRKRAPRDRHPRRRRSRRVRLQGARSPSGRPQQLRQVEAFEESEVLGDPNRTSSAGCATAEPNLFTPIIPDRVALRRRQALCGGCDR